MKRFKRAPTCRDADRSDPERVGIIPKPQRLCTYAARDLPVLRFFRCSIFEIPLNSGS